MLHLVSFKEGIHIGAATVPTTGKFAEPGETQLAASVASLECYPGCLGLRVLRLGTGMRVDNFFGRAVLGLSFVRSEGIVLEVLFVHIVIPI